MRGGGNFSSSPCQSYRLPYRFPRFCRRVGGAPPGGGGEGDAFNAFAHSQRRTSPSIRLGINFEKSEEEAKMIPLNLVG